jgi:hypothetical protein
MEGKANRAAREAAQERERERVKPSAASAGSSSCCHESMTIQALRMRNEVFQMGGMSRKMFTETYLGGIGEYERQLAAREGIEI